MRIRNESLVAVMLACCLSCPAAYAELVSTDSEFGAGTITRDTDTGLDWLDLTLTTNRTVTDIEGQLAAGGEFEGFRYASVAEVEALWLANGIVDLTTVGPITGSDWTVANFDPANVLAGFFGITIMLPSGPVSEGFTGDVPTMPTERVVAELNICTSPVLCPNVLGAPPNTALASLGPNVKDVSMTFDFIGHHLVREFADTDGDGVADDADNCTLVENPDQRDTNNDGFGNICDGDLDNDCNVNFVDLGQMKGVFFSEGDVDEDLDGDMAVNFIDLGILKGAIFLPPGPSGVPTDCD